LNKSAQKGSTEPNKAGTPNDWIIKKL
jgi:hypothetical protein